MKTNCTHLAMLVAAPVARCLKEDRYLVDERFHDINHATYC